MNYSTEQAAKIAQIIGFVLTLFKVDVGLDVEGLTQFIGAIIFVGATIYGWYKRFKRGDVTVGGFRK